MKENSYVMKFEGTWFEARLPHEMIQAELPDGRKVYVLNFSRRPSGIKEDCEFVICIGYKGEDRKSRNVVVGKGVLEAFMPENEVQPEWIRTYGWMQKYKYYAVIKEFDMIDSALEDCIPFDTVVDALECELYRSTCGKDVPVAKLHGYHARRQYMYITEKAKRYLDKELETYFEKFGVVKYKSE